MAPVPGVARLIEELEANPGVASGERRFHRRIRRDEAADVADFAHGEIDRAAAARDRAAADSGTPLVCAAGCTYCCEELIMVAAPEEATVARWLARDDNRDARQAFLAAYDDWRRRVGDVPEKLAELTARGEIERQQRLYLAQYRKRVLCAFNREGLCLVYPVRPIGCRTAHAVDTADYCRADHPSGRAPHRFRLPRSTARSHAATI